MIDQKEALQMAVNYRDKEYLPKWVERDITRAAKRGDLRIRIRADSLTENQMEILHKFGYGITGQIGCIRYISWGNDIREPSTPPRPSTRPPILKVEV